MKRYALIYFLVLMVGCAAPLTRQAQQIITIQDGGVLAMMNCKELGSVSGSGGIWGGTGGLEKAYSEAKNNAGNIPSASAMLITSRQMNPTAYVNAKVYDCSDQKTQKIEIVGDKAAPLDMSETFEKARKCQAKGGVWIEKRCVISLD